jgi:hypothetical protein
MAQKHEQVTKARKCWHDTQKRSTDKKKACVTQISEVMLPFNLRMNAGKTVELIFLTYRRMIPISEVIPWQGIFIGDDWIQEDVEFKYLGIVLDISCDTEFHVLRCLKLAKQAATQIGRLCRQMEVNDFARLRTYFFSFVVSQFHGQQLVTFPPEYYEEALMLFFRAAFSLPVGYPRAILYYFVGSLEFQAQQIISRLRFFQKHARTNGFLRSVFLEDRRLFLLRQICWNMDFQLLFESFLPNRSFSELNLFDPQDDIRSLLEREWLIGVIFVSPSCRVASCFNGWFLFRLCPVFCGNFRVAHLRNHVWFSFSLRICLGFVFSRARLRTVHCVSFD